MKLSIKEIQLRLKRLGLMTDEGEPVLYSAFKNMAGIHRYNGRSGTLKVVFIGLPKENLFGFYAAFKNDTDTNVLKEAYSNYLKLVKGRIDPYETKDVQWGNAGIPLVYGDLRYQKRF